MVQISKRKGKGATLNLNQEVLDGSGLQVGDHVTLIPGNEQIIIKLREREKVEE